MTDEKDRAYQRACKKKSKTEGLTEAGKAGAAGASRGIYRGFPQKPQEPARQHGSHQSGWHLLQAPSGQRVTNDASAGVCGARGRASGTGQGLRPGRSAAVCATACAASGRTTGTCVLAAAPEEMLRVFEGEQVIETGLKHGTLTVILDGSPLEITTYRTDGGYSDGRHPDGVRFVRSIREDLARRDFTVGAMAWHPERGLFDPFEGRNDLKNRILRAVGDPDTRFLPRMRCVFCAACALRPSLALRSRGTPLRRCGGSSAVFPALQQSACARS